MAETSVAMIQGLPLAFQTRVLSLWHPWAEAVKLGSKGVETRSWPTAYRGLLAIHASQRRPSAAEAAFLHSQPKWPAALKDVGWDPRHTPEQDFATLTYGAIVALVVLTGCRPTPAFLPEEIDQPRLVEEGAATWTERQMGNFEPDRFGWPLQLVRALPTPIPVRGRQRIFRLEPAAQVAMFAQLAPGELQPFMADIIAGQCVLL